MNFNPEIESKPLSEIKIFQEKELRKMLEYIQTHSLFYQNMFQKHHVDIQSIKTIEDLSKIPFTTKLDLQKSNKEFLCVNKNQIVDYITTSGTAGDPVTFAMSDNDLNRLAYNEAISFACTGGQAGETYQLMTTIDKRFMAGLAYFLGIRKLGASIIRVGNGMPELQWDTINRLSPDAIIVVPSFILRIIEYAEQHGIDYKNSSIKKAICIGENIREQDFSLNILGRKIAEKWDIELYSTYASTEMATSFTECKFGVGGHHHPELIIIEVVDDEGNNVEVGEIGELVITTLGVEAMPLLRFKTGDIVQLHAEPCQCGRTSYRISPLFGRKNQMLKLKGTTLFPGTIFEVLQNIDFIASYFVEVKHDHLGNDCIDVYVACKEIDKSETVIEKELKDHFRAKLRVAPNVIITDDETVRRVHHTDINRKPTIFIDSR
jgi:phenylacetate-CoA ligase